MKNCRSFEKQLTAYLHGELAPQEVQILEEHLAGCGRCRAELESERMTLELLGETLEAAPAPTELPAWSVMPQKSRPALPVSPLDRRLFKVRLISLAVAACFAVMFVMIAGSYTCMRVVGKSEVAFEGRTVQRPKMTLKKLQSPVKARKIRQPKVADAYSIPVSKMSALNMPAVAGLSSAESAYGDMPDVYYAGDRSQARALKMGSREFEDTLEVASDQVARTDSPQDKRWGFSGDSAFLKASIKENDAVEMEELPFEIMNELRVGYSDADTDSDALSDEVAGLTARQLRRLDPAPKKKERKPAAFNPYVMTVNNAFSTFSIDVDTASYGLARSSLIRRKIPEPESVRTEEFVNSFDYDYRPPAGDQTFTVHSELAPSPFRPNLDALKIGVKGRRIGRDDHRGAVLTLLIDTSGSMSTPERLGLIKESLALLIDQLSPNDEVAIVQFGNGARLVCEHMPVSKKEILLDAVESLQAGGPTQFDLGLQLGYEQATSGFRAGDSNRILILSDGVANLGELDPDAILEQVSAYRKKGIYLSVLGFGAGTYDDELLEQLADRGDGSYVYIDTMDEARRQFVDQLAATLHVIASDVKIQVEFNPRRVRRYRQLGYENRQLTKEQFRDDTVDAGEVGSGQSVTALYDVELHPNGSSDEPIATVYVRYRRADTGAIEEISHQVTDAECAASFEAADPRYQVAVCAAEFAEHLRRSPYADGTDAAEIAKQLAPAVRALNLDDDVETLQELISIVDRMEH